MLNPQDPKIIERYKALPQPLKDALWAEETIDHIFNIGKAQHLTVSQMGELADIVGLVVLGMLKPEDFGSEVQRKLNLTMERAAAADAIVAAINEKIFAPLRDEMMGAARLSPAIGKTSGVEEKLGNGLPTSWQAGKMPDVKEVEVPVSVARPPTPSNSSTRNELLSQQGSATLGVDEKRQQDSVAPGVDDTPRAAQPISIFAKHVPEPSRYQGKDPYREPIDGDHPEVLITKPTTPPPKAPQLSGQAPQVQKIISWSDISPEKEKANSHPDAKSALEKAMNNGVAAPRLQSLTSGKSISPSPAKISERNLGGQTAAKTTPSDSQQGSATQI